MRYNFIIDSNNKENEKETFKEKLTMFLRGKKLQKLNAPQITFAILYRFPFDGTFAPLIVIKYYRNFTRTKKNKEKEKK